MTGLLARNSGRLAFLAGAVAPALLALSLTPTIAGGPYFALGTGPNGHGSLGGFGGEQCTLGQGPSPCDLFPGNTQYGAVAAANAPPGAKLTSFDVATVDSILGLFFLADRGSPGIQVLNTRSIDTVFGMFNQPSYSATLCQGKFMGVGRPRPAQNNIDNTYNNGPNGLVVVNSRTVWAGDGNSTIKVCSLGGALLKTIATGGNARVGKGCFDPVDQTVLFVNDMERNYDSAWGNSGTTLTPNPYPGKAGGKDVYPFFNIYNAKTYVHMAGNTLNSKYLGAPPAYIAAMYAGSPPTTTAATNGVGSCIYETNTQTFWLAIPECYNQTAQTAYLAEFDFTPISPTNTPKSFAATAGGGGDPNAGHGCVAEIDPKNGTLKHVFDVGAPQFANPAAGPNPGLTNPPSTTCTVTIPSSLSAINGVCGATFKDVCVAPYGIVQGPQPQVLLGCGNTPQTTIGGETSSSQNSYKSTNSSCNGTNYPGPSYFTQGLKNPTSVTFKGNAATIGDANWPCMNPDMPTAVLNDGSVPSFCPAVGTCEGSLYAVITQMAGAEQVAIDNGGCIDFRLCDLNDNVSNVSFGPHYLLPSSGYHSTGIAASMCTIAGADSNSPPATVPVPSSLPSGAALNCFTPTGTMFFCPAKAPPAFVAPCVVTVTTITTAVPPTVTAGSLPPGFTVTQYNCGSANAVVGEATAVGQTPGPGLLNSVDAGGLASYITAPGQQVDPTPAPGPNHSPINIPAIINSPANSGQAPGYHTGNCSTIGSIVAGFNPSHSVAVDINTNQVFVAVPNTAVTARQGGAQIIPQFPGWQLGTSNSSLNPFDPQWPPSPKGNGVPPDCTPAAPCVGQQATPSGQSDNFTSLCARGTDHAAQTGSDTNGCILVLQDGP
jgi:hypothetical protein